MSGEKNELKPCPFCGKDVNLQKIAGWYQVNCEICGASQKASFYKHDVIENWNKRENYT